MSVKVIGRTLMTLTSVSALGCEPRTITQTPSGCPPRLSLNDERPSAQRIHPDVSTYRSRIARVIR